MTTKTGITIPGNTYIGNTTGYLYTNVSGQKKGQPVVVTWNGFTRNADMMPMKYFSEKLSEQLQITVFNGNTIGSESFRSPRSIPTPDSEIEQIKAVVEFFSQQEMQVIALIGHSRGGKIVGEALQVLPEVQFAIALNAPPEQHSLLPFFVCVPSELYPIIIYHHNKQYQALRSGDIEEALLQREAIKKVLLPARKKTIEELQKDPFSRRHFDLPRDGGIEYWEYSGCSFRFDTPEGGWNYITHGKFQSHQQLHLVHSIHDPRVPIQCIYNALQYKHSAQITLHEVTGTHSMHLEEDEGDRQRTLNLVINIVKPILL